MKKIFVIYSIENKDVHVPSDSYYARGNDSSTETLEILHSVYVEGKPFETYEAAEEYLLNSGFHKGTYIILPTYVKA